MRKKQKFEEFVCNSDDSNLSDRKLRSNNKRNSIVSSTKLVSNRNNGHKQCEENEFTDDNQSDCSDVVGDDPGDFSDPDYGGKHGKSDNKNKNQPYRSKLFIQSDDKCKEPLELPPSATDLPLELPNLWLAVGIYEVLYQFASVLRLTPFRFENFCSALCIKENSKLLVECHIALLKAILKEDEQNGILFTTKDSKDSVSISFYCVDDMTWYENICMYFQSMSEKGLKYLEDSNVQHYTSLTVEQKLNLLQHLVDLFLSTSSARDNMFREHDLIHEEHCRSCHKRGNLLCCESCPAMYHLSCIDPPLNSIPTGDWYCTACYKHKAVQMEEANSESLKSHLPFGRKEPVGFDRLGRQYWYLCKRIFVEDDEKLLAYYSTEFQLEELLEKFDPEVYEKFLVDSFRASRDDIVGDMKMTADLTNKYKDSRKTCLSRDDEQAKLRRMKEKNVVLDEIKKQKVRQPVKNEKNVSTKPGKSSKKSEDDSSNPWSSEPLFKLGMEGNFRNYINVYSTEVLALSRQLQFEEKEKRRHLSYKFSLTPAAEFSWVGGSRSGGRAAGVHGIYDSMVEILRKTLINFQESIPKPFMHSNWPLHSSRWLKAISLCRTAREFSLALMIFESCIKPFLFNNVWHQSLGHIYLCRTTASEREEDKKRDKEIRSSVKDEMNCYSEDSIKYSLGLHHTVWKQRGEEYRITGRHGWYWMSPARVTRVPRKWIVHNHNTINSPNEEAMEVDDSNETSEKEICRNNNDDVFDVERWFNTKPPLTNISNSTKSLNKLLERRLQMNDHVNELAAKITKKLNSLGSNCNVESQVAGVDRDKTNGDVNVATNGDVNVATNSSSVPNKVEDKSKNNERVTNTPIIYNLNDIIKRFEIALKTPDNPGEPNHGDNAKLAKNLSNMLPIVNSTNLRISLKTMSPSKFRKSNGGLPRAHNFEAGKRKTSTSVYVLDDEKLHKLARKAGMLEVPGYNYSGSGSFCPYVALTSNKKNLEMTNYLGCPRPNFQTAWRYRTRTANNFSSLALQLRILYSCIRWDDLYAPYPSNGILVIDGAENGTDDIMTLEILKRRIVTSKFDPINYKVEYLMLKTVIPKESNQPLPPSTGERSTQRTGLRERRVAEPVTSKEWVSEDQLELWQINYFADMWEKQSKMVNDKSLPAAEKQTPKVVTTPSSSSSVKFSNSFSRPQTPNNSCPQKNVASNNTNNNATPKTSSLTTQIQVQPCTPSTFIPPSSALSIEDELKRTRLEMQQKRMELKTTNSKEPTSAKELVIKNIESSNNSVKTQSEMCVDELVKHISVVKSPDGKLEVYGLKEGQEAIHLPGGKIKIIWSPSQPSTTPSSSDGSNNTTKSSAPVKDHPSKTYQDSNFSQMHLVNSNSNADNDLTTNTSPLKVEQTTGSLVQQSAIPVDSSIPQTTDQANKILAGLKNVFQKKVPSSQFHNKDKSEENKEINSESNNNISNNVENHPPLNNSHNGLDSDSHHSISSECSSKARKIEVEDGGKVTPASLEICQRVPEVNSNGSPICNISTPPTPASSNNGNSLQQQVITVGQFSSSNVVSRRMTIFDSSKPEGNGMSVDDDYDTDDDDDDNSSILKYTRKKRRSSSDTNPTPKKMARGEDGQMKETASVQVNPDDVKLHCLCRTPYDETKFYVSCNNCGGWYHGSCIGMTPEDASSIDKFVCDLCQQQSPNKLHCICRTPYDDTKFYVGCDECFGWFHGECMSISTSEAQKLQSFKCPSCKTSSKSREQQSLRGDHFLKLLQLLNELKVLPISQAFLDDSNQKNKRGFNFIEEKLLIRSYKRVEEFIEDFEGFFSDLRYYSLKQSSDYKAANKLQSVFQAKLQKVRTKF